MPDELRLDAQTCRAKAIECRSLSERATDSAHKVMLLHMAETWERIAEALENGS